MRIEEKLVLLLENLFLPENANLLPCNVEAYIMTKALFTSSIYAFVESYFLCSTFRFADM